METSQNQPILALIRFAAFCGVLGVGLGALGGHGLEDRLEEAGRMDVWRSATRYLLIHAVAALAVALAGGAVRPIAGWLFAAGGLVFGGSLYTLCLTGVTKFGAITPIGGLLLLAGWGVLLITPSGKLAKSR